MPTMSPHDSKTPTAALAVHRIEVRTRPGMPDSISEAALREAKALDADDAPQRIDTAAVYLIEGDLDPDEVQRIADELLCDPVTQIATIGAEEPRGDALVEVHPLPGVMDPEAEPIELAIEAMLGMAVQVRTGKRYDMVGSDAQTALRLAEQCFANRVIHAVATEPYHPDRFPAGQPYTLRIVDVPLRDLDDQQLQQLSRSAHLFLSLEEMQTIQAHYRALGREPREIELETLAQTWSEHCVHKTLKATIRYREPEHANDGLVSIAELCARAPRPGHELHEDGSVTIHNLLKSTIAAATNELIAEGIDWCLSVFVDNAGVIAFDDDHAVCFKVETHNHPSAIEPYGGAATGIGGCIRDIIGTGLAAQPIANTDVFCVAFPNGGLADEALPTGCLHPRRILMQVVAGVRDYGNRMGIPTLNGAVWFDDRYIGNPLVYCGCVGVMPRDMVKGEPRQGDHIIVIGGRTGRDGIHGATFSSAELTDTHADEFSHAVQIGNPVEEKKALDAILTARDAPRADRPGVCLYNAITDCGAGGFSSAVGEMGEKLGAEVHLDRAPLKYAGLTATEIWISEAQERMVLAVPSENIAPLQKICRVHDVEMCDLGTFGTPRSELILNYAGTEVGRLDMQFVHEGIPQTQREAVHDAGQANLSGNMNIARARNTTAPTVRDALLALLAHPNIASKHWIIRQYDHEVQGATVAKPLVGPGGEGPGDAAVVTPIDGSMRGLAIGCGLATNLSGDPYIMALAAIDECVRNLVCVGADPNQIAVLDNFCWPGCDDPHRLAGLVRAAEACYDGAKAYRTPFISGKDSLNNQFTTDDGRTIRIPPTLLISGIGIVPNVQQCITSDARRAGDLLLRIGPPAHSLACSHYAQLFAPDLADNVAEAIAVDGVIGPRCARAVAAMIADGLVSAAHDVSDGGLLVAAAEMCIGGSLGLDLDQLAARVGSVSESEAHAMLFGEMPSTYLLEVQEHNLGRVEQILAAHHLEADVLQVLGRFEKGRRVRMTDVIDLPVDELTDVWRATLDW